MLSKNQISLARYALERMYTGICTVTEHRKVKDEKTKITGYQDVIVLEGQSCKLSFQKITNAVQSDSVATVVQVIKLFISPDITIKPGSKITVTQDNITADYTYSGIPATYPTHQEIMLESFERWA